MKRRIALALRSVADRLDPQPAKLYRKASMSYILRDPECGYVTRPPRINPDIKQ